MEKILVLYGSYGGGHKSAANAIKQYIKQNYEDKTVETIDCIEYISKVINKITTGAYNQMAKKAPWAWKRVYFNSERGMLSKISNGTNALMSKKLCHLIQKENPDIIISTHPFATQMCGRLKRKGKISCKIATIMTDYEIHNQWLQEFAYIDKYFVAHEGMKNSMVKLGINIDKIFVTGIPMSERFLEKFDRKEIFEELNLQEDKKTILFFGGGEMGLGKDRTCEVLKVLVEEFKDIQVIAISGKNEVMKEKFNEIVTERKSSNRVKILEYTKKVPEFMSISDLVITKPGGLTTTESLASGLPMIIINPIPGQEEQNAEFLEKSKVGIWLKRDCDVKEVLKSVILSEDKLIQMKNNTIGLANKKSTKDICECILNNK